jgi:hypothetical protein
MHLYMAPMPVIPLFLFKLSVSLAVVWCFYQVVLRWLTFYKLNRWYLLGYTLISFLIPFINIGPMFPDGPKGEPVVIQFIPAIGGSPHAAVAAASYSAGLSMWTILLWVLAAGSAVLFARVVVRWVSLVRLRRKARLIGGYGVNIYQVDGPVTPFSFGNAIFINQHLYTEKEWADIILHEYVHIRQRHTVDILIAELVCIVNWYNPFAWLIRYSVRQNLEFIADQQVLEKGVDRKGYQYHLLKVVGEPRYRLANNFNFSSLKRRIIMMNKMRSAKVHLLKLMFLLPLVAVLLVAFRHPGTPGLEGFYKKYGEIPGYMASDHPEGHQVNSGYLARWAAIAEQAQREFRTTNPNVRAVIFPGDSRVIVVPVSGKPQFYDMDNDAVSERQAFESMYGKLPDCVPEAGSSDEMKRAARLTAPRAAGGVRDAVPVGQRDTVPIRQKDVLKMTGQTIIRLHRDTTLPGGKDTPLYVIDGKVVPGDSINTFDPNQIGSITVLKDSAGGIEQYGQKGKNGVVIVHTKGYLDTRKVGMLPAGPLYIVDGREMDRDSVSHLHTYDIESITVLKNSTYIEKYGERGRNGVILIKLKYPGGVGPEPRGQDGFRVDEKNGRWTLDIGNVRVNGG